jgi:transposase-like protein
MRDTNVSIRALFPAPVVERAQEWLFTLDPRPAPHSRRRADPGYALGPELTALVVRSGSDDKCRSYLERLRWPTGVTCPRCHAGDGISPIPARGQYDCGSCGYQFSVQAGTVFHASHLRLWKWCLAAFIMTASHEKIPANRLAEMLGVSYKTAWFLSHRIRAALEDEVHGSRSSSHGVGPSDVSEKHLPRYDDEVRFRSNTQGNPYLFRDILLRLLEAEALPYKEPVASA